MLSEDIQENPGTLALAVSWVLIFALILLVQWYHPVQVSSGTWTDPLPVSTITSHRFGDMTWLEVRQGQPWRLITATFVHFGLIHVALNVLALIVLGRLVEPWYRTGPFLAICLVIGGLGNLLGGALRQFVGIARPWLALKAAAWHWPGRIERLIEGGPVIPVSIHSGGGSTILLGLLTLAAVVGWRSKTRIGEHLQRQMLIPLGLTAVLGVALPNLVDNYGHLGGAIVGVLIGLLDRPLFRLSDRKTFRVLGWVVASLVLVACLVSAVRHDRIEVEAKRRVVELAMTQSAKFDLERLYMAYVRLTLDSAKRRQSLNKLDETAILETFKRVQTINFQPNIDPAQIAKDRAELVEILGRVDRIPSQTWGEETAANLARLRALGQASLEDPPTYPQTYEFVVCWLDAMKAILAHSERLNPTGIKPAKAVVKAP